MERKLNFEEFLIMLHELDEKLTKNITIKAIGGFSMIINAKVLHINLDRKSRDIDSLTVTWENGHNDLKYKDIEQITQLNEEIDSIIWDIGEKFGCNGCDGWLNNSWYDSKTFEEELEPYIDWQTYTEDSFKHITLQYADLESIFLFKMRSINEIITGQNINHNRPRENDIYDVINILKFFKENDISNIKNIKMSKAIISYQPAIQWLKDNIRLI